MHAQPAAARWRQSRRHSSVARALGLGVKKEKKENFKNRQKIKSEKGKQTDGKGNRRHSCLSETRLHDSAYTARIGLAWADTQSGHRNTKKKKRRKIIKIYVLPSFPAIQSLRQPASVSLSTGFVVHFQGCQPANASGRS